MIIINDDHPKFESFIRAFWRRIEPYKNDFGKELPEKIPIQFKTSMATAFLVFKNPSEVVDTGYMKVTYVGDYVARAEFDDRNFIILLEPLNKGWLRIGYYKTNDGVINKVMRDSFYGKHMIMAIEEYYNSSKG